MSTNWIAIQCSVIAVVWAWATPLRADESQQREAAIAEIANVGKISQETVDELPIPVMIVQLRGQFVNDAILAQLKAIKDVYSLELVDTKITDEGLAHLEELSLLTRLVIGDIQITDKGLKHIGKLKRLNKLHLNCTNVTDAGLANLKGCIELATLDLAGSANVSDIGLENLKEVATLTRLNLYGTSVTDAGLGHVTGLTKLRWLVLRKTNVTAAGIEALQVGLPRCNIFQGAE